jgi:urease accessory protein
VAGIAHGYAFAESIIGAETGVIAAYVLGLILVQMIFAAAIYVFTRAIISGRAPLPQIVPRVMGLAILAIGAFFTLDATGFVH